MGVMERKAWIEKIREDDFYTKAQQEDIIKNIIIPADNAIRSAIGLLELFILRERQGDIVL